MCLTMAPCSGLGLELGFVLDDGPMQWVKVGLGVGGEGLGARG